jgi:toxin-antitoxin system PIN domain toxin
MTRRALLDTSVLIALLDASHIHHTLCTQWLGHHTGGWASCPITLNGCVRIMAQPSYPNRLPMQTVVAGLHQAMQHPMHAFWADEINPLPSDALDWERLLRPTDITDAYLLSLAVSKQGCLVSLDKGIALSWVVGAKQDHLWVLI